MQHLGLVTGWSTPCASAMKAYEDLYETETEPNASNIEALAALFNDDAGNELCRQRQKRKLSS